MDSGISTGIRSGSFTGTFNCQNGDIVGTKLITQAYQLTEPLVTSRSWIIGTEFEATQAESSGGIIQSSTGASRYGILTFEKEITDDEKFSLASYPSQKIKVLENDYISATEGEIKSCELNMETNWATFELIVPTNIIK